APARRQTLQAEDQLPVQLQGRGDGQPQEHPGGQRPAEQGGPPEGIEQRGQQDQRGHCPQPGGGKGLRGRQQQPRQAQQSQRGRQQQPRQAQQGGGGRPAPRRERAGPTQPDEGQDGRAQQHQRDEAVVGAQPDLAGEQDQERQVGGDEHGPEQDAAPREGGCD